MAQTEPGGNGDKKNAWCRWGRTALSRCQQGTLVKDEKNGRILADLTRKGQKEIIARAERAAAAISTLNPVKSTAPQYSELGALGKNDIMVELGRCWRMSDWLASHLLGNHIAVRCIQGGAGNRGIPLATLAPNLGMVQVPIGSFVMADLPD